MRRLSEVLSSLVRFYLRLTLNAPIKPRDSRPVDAVAAASGAGAAAAAELWAKSAVAQSIRCPTPSLSAVLSEEVDVAALSAGGGICGVRLVEPARGRKQAPTLFQFNTDDLSAAFHRALQSLHVGRLVLDCEGDPLGYLVGGSMKTSGKVASAVATSDEVMTAENLACDEDRWRAKRSFAAAHAFLRRFFAAPGLMEEIMKSCTHRSRFAPWRALTRLAALVKMFPHECEDELW